MDKIYEVTDIDFRDLVIEGRECDLDVSDVPEEELFDIELFRDFQITLHNWHGQVVDFGEWVKKHEKS